MYPAVKQLALDVATTAFVGAELGSAADRVNRAFVATVCASTAFVRAPVPACGGGVGCGRALLEQHFAAMLPAKHASDGNDLFTALCHAEAEDGAMFRDSDVVDHMIFLLMAAHDTVTITLSTMMYELARHPAWQERLREEAISFGPGSPGFDDLATFASLDLVMRESMRLVAPVPALPRRTTRDTEVLGYFIPADALVSVNPSLTHRLDAYWSEPDRFDPERFSAERREDATHRWAYVPFGGGSIGASACTSHRSRPRW